MNTEHDQFEQVRKLLALKKHEQPPPRYFQEFSSKVIARLHALEAARTVTWRQRLGLDFDFKPAMVGVFGVAVCGLLLVAVVTSLGVPSSATPEFPLVGNSTALFSASAANPVFAGGVGLNPMVKPDEIPASTVPVSDTGSSPFNQLLPRAQRAGFMAPPGN